MCEDLGGSFDTDFNDIVYDVKYENPVCTITIQAAGGTMPIELWYGLKDKGGYQLTHNNKSEVHDMFGTKVPSIMSRWMMSAWLFIIWISSSRWRKSAARIDGAI